ncbi:hypothetical protein, partial [Pantoea septica]|uniref:hypothetical protein n=1 Tax=Pantoea septica TaxID=472695 RepID=UPI00289B6409
QKKPVKQLVMIFLLGLGACAITACAPRPHDAPAPPHAPSGQQPPGAPGGSGPVGQPQTQDEKSVSIQHNRRALLRF